jgi:hypothetical protein
VPPDSIDLHQALAPRTAEPFDMAQIDWKYLLSLILPTAVTAVALYVLFFAM